MLRAGITLGFAVALVIIILAAATAAGMYLTDGKLLSTIGVVQQKRTTQSELIFEEARDLYQLITAEYVVKAVFPHDFIPGGYSLSRILSTVRNSNRPLDQILTRRERAFLELYNIGLDTGIPIDPESRQFIVFTVILSAGYDIHDTPFDSRADSAILELLIDIDYNNQNPAITMVIPDPSVLSIQLEDPTSDTYRYPDVRVSPSQLRRISDYIRSQMLEHEHTYTLLKTANANGRRFITQMLHSAGFETVRLMNYRDFNGGAL
ncbi:MAG: DUF4230 domain-containing protein [Spirochaeta sp.]